MQIIDNKALLLRVKQPDQILSSLDKAALVGEYDVLVKWDLEQALRLRNLGYKVPSPIEGRYSWPGKFKPMDHQKKTAAFLTMNTSAFCFSEQGCVDSETEYLSPTGWVKISEYKGGKVAQYNPHDAHEIEFVEPEAYVKLPCTDMLRIKTKYGVDQLLSPEHRVLLEDGKQGGFKRETVSAEVLAGRQHMYFSGEPTVRSRDAISFSSATVPTTFLHIPDSKMPYTDAQIRVLVAAIADGYFGSRTNHCVIRLKKARKKERLRRLLTEASITFDERPCLPEGFTKFTFTSPARWKEFGPEFWEASCLQRIVIAEEVLHWDGCTTRGSRFSTSSKASADYIQYVFASIRHTGAGGTARITSRERKGSVEHTVQIRPHVERLYVRGSGPTITPEPSTDGFKYCFRVPSTYLIFRRNGCIFASGNTGKTASVIWAADYLMSIGKVRRVLVICPVSIMDVAWRADLFSFAMHRTVGIAHGTAEKRRKVLAQNTEFVIINFDGVEVVQKELAAGGFDVVVVDECTSLKNAQTKRWKVLKNLLRELGNPRLWMMTGTPAAQGPEDAYGLAKLVNPDAVPRTFGGFKDLVMIKVSQFKWEPRQGAHEIVHRVLQPAIRFTKEECLDLPEQIYVKREVALTKQQKKYYELLRKEMLMEASGSVVTAVNAAVQMNKLLQVAAGAVYDTEGATLEFDIRHRYTVLEEAIAEATKKVLVFVPYTHVIDVLYDKMQADGYTVDIIRGDVPVNKRTEIFNRFQREKNPQILLIQPQAAAHGVTLTAADTVVWWGPVSSLEIYAQANARVHRSGQTHKCTVVQLQGSPVERRLYDMLDRRVEVNTRLVDLYREVLD
jgi:superfamily II DNA or RNA helicase